MELSDEDQIDDDEDEKPIITINLSNKKYKIPKIKKVQPQID